jgi:hypothetical protein
MAEPLGQAGGELLSLQYDVSDREIERHAWAALKAALSVTSITGH